MTASRRDILLNPSVRDRLGLAPAEPCQHEKVQPTFPEGAGSLPVSEIRRLYPRFDGVCPDCGERWILYASIEHYVAGDW